MNAPDRIWLHPITEDDFQDAWFTRREDGDVEYVKAAALTEAQAEIARLRGALLTIRDNRLLCPRAVDCAQIARSALSSTTQE